MTSVLDSDIHCLCASSVSETNCHRQLPRRRPVEPVTVASSGGQVSRVIT